MSYIQYTLLIGISIVASFITMGLWGKLIDKRGSKFVLTISGFMIPFSPFLMVLAIYIPDVSFRFIFLLFGEVLSGATWAAFNLSTSSFLFDATSKEERVKYISYYTFLIGIAVFLGAVLGGVLIKVYPIWVVSAIPFVLLTSGLLRLLVTSIFIRKVREAKMVEIDFPGRGFFHRVLTINPKSHLNVDIIGVYENNHQTFHNVLPKKKVVHIDAPKFADKKSEKAFYEHKTFEYYKENAMKTLEKETEKEKAKKK
jgi:MFS family permease